MTRLRRYGVCLVLLGLAAPIARAETRPATDVRTFLDTLGVNTHIAYKDGAYADVRLVVQDLHYLGITHIREGIVDHWGPDTASLADYVALAKAGMKFDLVVSHRPESDSSFLDTNLAMLAVLQKAMPGSIVAVEGPNEINNWPVAAYKSDTGTAAALAAQRDLYAAAHARNLAVYDLTGGPRQTTLAGRADYANQHPYSHNGMQPGMWIPRGFDEAYAIPGGYKRVITEIGNFSLPVEWPAGKPWWEAGAFLGVDEATQAKSILNTYFDAFAQGVSRTYIYELLDQKPDPAQTETFMHYGLFRADHAPKPAATAIHNLTAILAATRKPSPAGGRGQGEGGRKAENLAADNPSPRGGRHPHPSPVPPAGEGEKPSLVASTQTGLDYTLAGMPATASAVLLQKTDGVFVLALWNEAPFWAWDAQNSHPVASAPVQVTLTLGQEALKVQSYDPLVAATPIQTGAGARELGLTITDHPILVAITPH